MAKRKKTAKKKKKVSIVKTRKKQCKPRGKPFKKGHKKGFQKGQSGNPLGRPKGTMQRTLMFEALAEVEKAKGKSIFVYAFERAWENDTVLTAMLKKLVPDMAYIESDAGQTLTDIFAAMVGNGKPK